MGDQCLLMGLLSQKPQQLPPAREVDVVLVSIVAVMCVVDAAAALRGAKAAMSRTDAPSLGTKPKDD